MTHLGRIKNVEVLVSPTVKVFESHKAIENGNEMSSSTIPRAISTATMAYISSVESESSGKQLHRAMHSNLA
ncbi:Filensin [Gossypium arboreum]|uniref:Filensin n=1 Tax=Gossypium arboreum TaxID=29729 RepID=A0A0B0NC64_GOSAR|nr:Filensin [Gossypium arboreum]